MSSALALAAVTAAIKDLLNDGLLNHDLSQVGSFTVSALPPDRISTNPTEPNQLNLFLYHMSPNLGWRNAGLPSRDSSGGRVANPPLALDLHYLLTAYGSEDFHAEILLGFAMQLLHDNPVLTRAQLRTVLGGVSPIDGSILPSPFGNLSALDLAEQVELIKITPLYPSPDELSKMWTAMQARYRPSMAYSVSVVLIQSSAAVKQAPPVLQRGKDDRGFSLLPAWPEISQVRAAASPLLPALRLGDKLLVSGSNLDSGTQVKLLLENPSAGLSRVLQPDLDILPERLFATLPSPSNQAAAMHEWSIGAWQASLRSQLPNGDDWVSNRVPVVIAPQITLASNNALAGDISLSLECSPRILPHQESGVRVIFGNRMLVPSSINTPADPLLPSTMVVEISAVQAGEYLLRLRVDGVDSLPVLLSGSPPKLSFDPSQKVSVA